MAGVRAEFVTLDRCPVPVTHPVESPVSKSPLVKVLAYALGAASDAAHNIVITSPRFFIRHSLARYLA
jgi:hypothetical protein